MNLNKEQHDKLVENFKSIIDYLEKNVILKIITDVYFCLDNSIDVSIAPISNNRKYWIMIRKNNAYFTTKEYPDIFFVDELNGHIFDLFDGTKDDILYSFIENWDFIKERCKVKIDDTKRINNNINNFSVENNVNTSNMKIYLIQKIEKAGYFQINIKNGNFFLNKETAIKKLQQDFNEQTERCKQYCYNLVEWRNEMKFIIRDSRDQDSIYQIFEIVERELNVE